jgi:hypothetical protein
LVYSVVMSCSGLGSVGLLGMWTRDVVEDAIALRKCRVCAVKDT